MQSKAGRKYVILVGDGMGDLPIAELGNRTPLMAAHTPAMDFVAGHGELCLLRTVPEGFAPGSDVANLSLLGYLPGECYSGRAPLEAASLGVDLAEGEIAFRCNLVTLRFAPEGRVFMEDYSSGHISSEEAAELGASPLPCRGQLSASSGAQGRSGPGSHGAAPRSQRPRSDRVLAALPGRSPPG
jgi:2,3-diphosphopglycerate-independent phosphoglycerate mutase